MNWFAGKPLSTAASVLAVSVDDMAMDCCDDERIHVWVYCMAWSSRRAFLTGGGIFLRAHLENLGHDPLWVSTLLGGSTPTDSLRRMADLLRDQYFYLDMIGPDDEADAGERIEITRVRPTPPIEEVEARIRARMNRP